MVILNFVSRLRSAYGIYDQLTKKSLIPVMTVKNPSIHLGGFFYGTR